MRREDVLRAVVVAVALGVTAGNVAAQTTAPTTVSVSLRGILSWQPVDDAYVGSPYLDAGLGGIGPGFAVGLETTLRRLVVVFDYTRAAIDVTQTGRLVSGTAEGQLRDTLFSFLAGAPIKADPETSIVALAGISVIHGQPLQNGSRIDARSDPAAEDGKGPIGLTAGVDFVRALGGRVGFIASGRYSLLPRSRRAEELGVGPHVFRAGAGVRILLGSRS